MRLFSDILNHNILTRRLKNVRDRMVDAHFRKRPAASMILPPDFNPGGAIVFVIAYNTHPCIEVMLNRWQALMSPANLVVVDNSSSKREREIIAQLCFEGNVPYVGLPKNPEWSVNRSHGIAMNWAYFNLVSRWSPEIFGFLDHDCFPFEKFDLRSAMLGYHLFGLKVFSPNNPSLWNLWAGFCFYRTNRLKGLKVDFKPSVEKGLDTGGGNWSGVYARCNQSEVRFAEDRNNVIFDHFFHVGGVSYRDKFSTTAELLDLLPAFCRNVNMH